MSDSNDKTDEVRERLEDGDEETEETTDSEPLLTLDSDEEGVGTSTDSQASEGGEDDNE